MFLETYKFTSGSSNLKEQHKVCVKEMKEKSVTFTKGKSKFIQNHREGGGWEEGEVTFLWRILVSSFKLMFTDSAVAME